MLHYFICIASDKAVLFSTRPFVSSKPTWFYSFASFKSSFICLSLYVVTLLSENNSFLFLFFPLKIYFFLLWNLLFSPLIRQIFFLFFMFIFCFFLMEELTNFNSSCKTSEVCTFLLICGFTAVLWDANTWS